jgi:hypothetical protein
MNKKYAFLVLFLFSQNLFAWTLNNSSRSGFPISEIKVKVTSDNCANAGLTASALEAIVQDAIDQYWNTVSTSSLKLESLGLTSASILSDDATAAGAKADANGILIGCSQNSSLFTSNSTLGVGGLGCSNGVCRGVVLMNDRSGTVLATSSRDTIVTALAHEMGHAVGLGHSSVQGALMYYSLSNKTQKALHQDDIDGINYLYPNEKKVAGLAGACGSIDVNQRPDQVFSFLVTLVIGIAIAIAIPKLKRFNV